MKKVLSLLLFLLLCLFSIISNAEETSREDDFDTARAIANFMEGHYGISILIGPECESFSSDTFSIGNKPSGRSPFRDLLGIYSYATEIQMIDDTFSIYPPGFFEKFKCDTAPNGLRILIPNQILHEGQSKAGVVTLNDGYYNLYLAVGMFNELNIHHEIWHAIEFRIQVDYPDAFNHWSDLNPENYEYTHNYNEQDIFENNDLKDEWFVIGYSIINEMEDRATVIEALFRYDPDWWNQHPHIQKKLDFLIDAAKPIFGNVYFYE